jgi:hypothetical protein
MYGIAQLPNLYAGVDDAFAHDLAGQLHQRDVYLVEYPDATHSDDGSFCNASGLFGKLPIVQKAWKWASDVVGLVVLW